MQHSEQEVIERVKLIPLEVRGKVHRLKALIDPSVEPMFGYGEDGSMLIVLRSQAFGMRFLIRPDTSVNVAWEDQGGMFREAKKGSLEFGADVDVPDIMRPLYRHIFDIAEDRATDRMAEEICQGEDARWLAEVHKIVTKMRKAQNKRKKQARARTGRR